MSNQLTFFFFSMLIVVGLLLFYWAVHVIKQKNKFHQILVEESPNKPSSTLKKAGNSFMDLLFDLFSKSGSGVKDSFYMAGFYDFKYAHLFIPAKWGLGVLGAVIIGFYYHGVWSELMLFGVAFLWLMACVVIPDIILNYLKVNLCARIAKQMPYLLDLIAVCLQTGLTIERALIYVEQEMRGFDNDLAHILKRMNDQAQVVGLAEALNTLHYRLPIDELRSFAYTLRQNLSQGTSIYEMLMELAADIRDAHLLELEDKAGRLSAKMSIPLILLIMFPLVIIIVAPSVMRLLYNA